MGLIFLLYEDNLFLEITADDCEPCPSNGECYDGKLECLQGYRKHGKLCVEDGDINKSAKIIVCSLNHSYSGLLILMNEFFLFGDCEVSEDYVVKK